MFPQSKIFIHIILILCLSLYGAYSESNGKMQCCIHSVNGTDEFFNCSCSQSIDILIIEDLKGRCGKEQFTIPNTTTQWILGECTQLHLSGSTLLQLPNLHALYLHNIDQIHIASDFLNQYNTHLRSLRLSHAKFSPADFSLNIHAQKMESIILEHLTLEGVFNILLQTEDTHYLSNLSIKHCSIDNLGEVNLSTRYVKIFSLEHNKINIIQPSAIFQDSSFISFVNNSIGKMNFLSLDSDVFNFTFVENKVDFIAIESMVVNNSTIVYLANNSFYHIEQFGLTWLQPRLQSGRMIFHSNDFYELKPATLLFYYSIYNENLVIENNVFHTEQCTCNTHSLIAQMTDADNETLQSFYKERIDTYEMFINTSYCVDGRERRYPMSDICKPEMPNYVGISVSVLLLIMGITVLITARKRIFTYFNNRWHNMDPTYHVILKEFDEN